MLCEIMIIGYVGKENKKMRYENYNKKKQEKIKTKLTFHVILDNTN